MGKQFRRIGVLTSGGDAPGMNNVVRAVTRSALSHGVEVIGINGGYSGLIHDDVVHLDSHAVSNIVTRGGTMLYSARCPEFKSEEGMAKAIETCHKYNIDGIVACGGDGTFRGATDISNRGIPAIGIPGTIDNDITSTEYAIGYDTAMNTVIEMVDRLRDTCESHSRCNVVEVMGNAAGGIAINTAIACGAVGCFINEIQFDEEAVIRKLNELKISETNKNGKRGFIVIVTEGNPYYSEAFAKRIQEATNIETKFARLAHVVRGGSPTLRDRVTAAKMGSLAVEKLLEGQSNLVICERKNEICALDINFAQKTDRMYKGKLKDGELDDWSETDVAAMKAECAAKHQHFENLYKLMTEISG